MHALPGTDGVLRFLDTACWFHRAPGVTLVRNLRTIDFILLLARMLSSSLIASNFYFERITHER